MNEKQDRLKTSRCIYKSIFSKCDKCEDKYRDLIQTKVLLLEKAISITLKCELRVWWFEWEMSGCWVVGPQLVALAGEIMELLRGEALMEEVCRGDVWIWGFIALLHFQRPPLSLSPSLSSLPASLPSSAHQSVCLFFSLSLPLLCWLRCDGSGFCSTMSPWPLWNPLSGTGTFSLCNCKPKSILFTLRNLCPCCFYHSNKKGN